MNPLPLDPEVVRGTIVDAPTESDAVVGVYRLVYPDWDAVTSVDGHPACNKETWCRICRWFQELTERLNKARAYDKKVMPGGPWMNWGFQGTALQLKDWEVQPAPVTRKEAVLS